MNINYDRARAEEIILTKVFPQEKDGKVETIEEQKNNALYDEVFDIGGV